jgi:translation initiation factor IF-1
MHQTRFTLPINANNVRQRHTPPFIESGFRFPTTKDIEQIVAEITPDLFHERNSLIDRYLPTSTTFAHEIEMYVLRSQEGESPGMTFVHQLGSNALPIETRASKLDLARASWSPLHFKEARVWEEKEMLLLGRLTEEVQASQIDEQIANSLMWLMSRMVNRRDWMGWQLMRTGRVVIDGSDSYNPNGLTYTVDYQVTDMELTLVDKFDEKDSTTGKSKVDPIEYFLDLKKAAMFKPEIMPVKLITNSGFIEVLADNTYIQYLVDYERGWTAIEMRPPRSVYRAAALDLFTRMTALPVEIYDGTYEDSDGNIKHWLPNGEMIVICQNDAPLGNFVYTGHIAGMSNGRVQIGTGPYVNVEDNTRGDPPYFKIIAGFHGLPQLKGYRPQDFSYNRIKWLEFAANPNTSIVPEQPVYPDETYRRPLGTQASPTGR